MKNKTIDKQVLSALAIGIGAGILLNPVTARADEGEDNTVGLDDKVEEHTNEVTAEESSEAKDYSEAVQAESEAVKEADNEILNAEAMVNQALEGADEADKSDYQAVSDALVTAAESVANAGNNLENSQDVSKEVNNVVDSAAETDNSVKEQSDNAQKEYEYIAEVAQQAAEIANAISAETTSLEEAEKAASDAQALLDQAESEKAAQDESFNTDEAGNDVAGAAADLAGAQEKVRQTEQEISAANEELKSAEEALLDAKEAMDRVVPASDEIENLKKDMYQTIIDQINELRTKSEADEDYDEKLSIVVGNILCNYVLKEDDYFNPRDYLDGSLKFDAQFKDGELTITFPGVAEGYYTKDGLKLVMSESIHTFDDGYGNLYVIDTKDEAVDSEDAVYKANGVVVNESAWKNYEKGDCTEKVTYEQLDDYKGNIESGGTVTEGITKAVKVITTKTYEVRDNASDATIKLTETSSKTYKSTDYRHSDEIPAKIMASTQAGWLKKGIDNHNKKIQQADEAVKASEAYKQALYKVQSAGEKIADLKEKSEALLSQLRTKISVELANNQLAQEKVADAISARENAQNKIATAKEALASAKDRVNQIKERLEKERIARDEAVKNSQNNDSSRDTGSDAGNSEGDASDNTVVTSASTNVAIVSNLVDTTNTREAVLGASRTLFYRNLADELSSQILAQRNNNTDVSKAEEKGDSSRYVVEPAAKAKTETTTVLKSSETKSIEDSEVALSDSSKATKAVFPVAIVAVFAAAMGVTVEELYRRKKDNN